MAAVGEGGLGTVVCELDSEGPAGWQIQDVSCSRGSGITAAAVLEPPVRLREVVERVDGEVGVAVVDCRIVTAKAVHSLHPCYGVGIAESC